MTTTDSPDDDNRESEYEITVIDRLALESAWDAALQAVRERFPNFHGVSDALDNLGSQSLVFKSWFDRHFADMGETE